MWKTKTSAGMKDNPVKKALRKFGTRKDRYVSKLRKRWERLSYRQQRLIILYLLGLFAAVDLAYIAGAFCGTNPYPIEVQHIRRVVLPQTDSIKPLKHSFNDTIR